VRGPAARQVLVAASAVVAVVVSTVGSGAFGGTPIAEAAGGALASDATPLAPAGPAFAIWSVIYLGLLALAAWQALPAQRDDARVDRLRPWVAASLLLNALWVLTVQAGWLGASVAVIAALVLVLGWVFHVTTLWRPRRRLEAIVLDGTMGLYLGWVVVATAANVTAWLAARGFGERTTSGVSGSSEIASVVVLALAGAVGCLLAHLGEGRVSVALSMVWGLAWIVVARVTGDLVSAPAALAAAAAAGAIIAVTIAARPGRTERRWAREQARRAGRRA
jgi:hypothetical protein